ncbi:MAG: serine hydrolase [Bacteroidia bacterium]
MKSIKFVTRSLALGLLLPIVSLAQIKSNEIDQLVESALKAFNVPGIAVGVIKDGKLVHAKGYGVRNLNTKEKVDENTFFGVASNSKAFTTAALAMLVDEGKLNWDDKVRKYIPNFKLSTPYITEEFTVRDLVCHRSGLGLGAGDLMMWPDSNKFTKNDIIIGLQYLEPVSSFRTKFDYNNNFFIVAGEVVNVVSGMIWEEFIENKIMRPIGMKESAASLSRLKNKSNAIVPHAPIDGKLQVIDIGWSETANAAGGIWTNINELSKWVITHLNKGKYGPDLKSTLFSEKQQTEMWKPTTLLADRNPKEYNTHFSAYGLGWFLSDINGKLQVTHTGGLAGIVTQVIMFPEINLGIIVLTNQQSGAAFTAISNTIKESYLGLPKKDWVKDLSERMNKFHQKCDEIVKDVYSTVDANKSQTPDLNNYIGKYQDAWFGNVSLSKQGDVFHFRAEKSQRMRGTLHYYKANTFVVKWDNRAFDADAFLKFSLDENGKATGFTMEAFSPITDFSFDFQDLNFNSTK